MYRVREKVITPMHSYKLMLSKVSLQRFNHGVISKLLEIHHLIDGVMVRVSQN